MNDSQKYEVSFFLLSLFNKLGKSITMLLVTETIKMFALALYQNVMSYTINTLTNTFT